jgi:hypothetical protein
MIPNTRKPVVHVVGCHAYVYLKDYIADILAHGYDVDDITPTPDDVDPFKIYPRWQHS